MKRPNMKFFEFGTAPQAVAMGYKMAGTVQSTKLGLLLKHAGEDIIFVYGPSIHGEPDRFEFARFVPVASPKKVLELPENERNYAKMVGNWEQEIASNADYILAGGVKHPVNDLRASRRAIELATARKIIIDLHPAIDSDVLDEVADVLRQKA